MLCYQYGGESESGLAPMGSPENWRCVVFEKLRRVELLNGSWKTAPNHLGPATCVVDASLGGVMHACRRLFGEVTERCVRRGSHTAVRALARAMLDYLDQHNENPRPFVWTADADLILGKVERLSKRISRSGH